MPINSPNEKFSIDGIYLSLLWLWLLIHSLDALYMGKKIQDYTLIQDFEADFL